MKIQLVSSSPSKEDHLSHQSHAKLAIAIKSLITSTGGKFIGLSGRWGSGKSTVIEILNQPEMDNLYIHDIWSKNKANHYHSLMSGIAHHRQYKDDQISKINSFQQKSTNTATFSPTKSELIFIALIIFLPFSIQFFNTSLGMTEDVASISRGMHVFGWLVSIFTAILFLIVSLNIFLNYRVHKMDSLKGGKTDSSDAGMGVLWGSATKKTLINNVQVEEDWGERLFRFLRDVCESGAFSICVDNIERLSVVEQNKAWEFMSYLRSCQYRLLLEEKNLNVIATFSKSGVTKHGSDYVKKIFDVVYHIPDFPGMVGESYAEGIVFKLFPDVDVKEIVGVLFYKRSISSPSPREIVFSVNRAVSLYNLHAGNVSVFSCFVFSSYSEEIDSSIGSLGAISRIFPRFILDSDHYNEDEILRLALCSEKDSVIQYRRYEIILRDISSSPDKWVEGERFDDPIYILAAQNFVSRLKDMDGRHYGVAFVLSGLFSDKVFYFRHVPVRPADLVPYLSSLSSSSLYVYHDQDRIFSLFKEWMSHGSNELLEFVNAVYSDYIVASSEVRISYSLYRAIWRSLDAIFSSDNAEHYEAIAFKAGFRSDRAVPDFLEMLSWVELADEIDFWDSEFLFSILKKYMASNGVFIPRAKLGVVYAVLLSIMKSNNPNLVSLLTGADSGSIPFPIVSVMYFAAAISGMDDIFEKCGALLRKDVVADDLVARLQRDADFLQIGVAGALVGGDDKLLEAIRNRIPDGALSPNGLNEGWFRELIESVGAVKWMSKSEYWGEIRRLYHGVDD